MVNQKSLENLKKGKKFGPDHAPAQKAGRKKSQLKDFMIKEEVSLADVKKVFQGLILSHSADELTRMVKKDKTLPIIVTMCISAFLHDTKRGMLVSMDSILNRVYGKPVQTDIIEVHDMPEDVKKRMLSIYQKEATAPIKPKIVVPKREVKSREEL